MKDISRLTKKRFSYSDVIEPEEDYRELGNRLNELIERGRIRPIKSSGTVSVKPYFYREYFINDQPLIKQDFSTEINRLAPALIEYYLNHPDHYPQDRDVLLVLSEWLKQTDTITECSVKERSYEIFRNEKKLEGNDARRVLGRNGLSYEALGCYRTYEPYFRRTVGTEGCVLVLENKDPWYSIDRAMKAGHTEFFLGRRIRYLIYGEGRKADAKEEGSRLQDYLFSLEWKPEAVLYCGDIDRAGVSIFTACREVNKDLDIMPFTELYNAMVRKAPEHWEDNERSLDSNTKVYDRQFADLLEDPEYVRNVLEHNLRIPQEILNYKDYLRMCGEGNE